MDYLIGEVSNYNFWAAIGATALVPLGIIGSMIIEYRKVKDFRKVQEAERRSKKGIDTEKIS